MTEKWMMNRIGLINFWYYDDQEFDFVNGRMLLRGANGSGKSVTMQSVIPLLMDGNMRPERLDPFGSRDRKMSGYLLEDGDGREERTGYLYMEFLKKETGIYSTIGMGIRARRGKGVDSWYFCITDGRRINRDMYLYKEADEKVTLTERELINRIGEGGRVMDSQMEYAEYVNQQFFGFENVESYKEMVDLLIQLRTPKLSKDFKPSVINEILNESLQPLSEDDLRPMSEAIENMDIQKTNLANKENSAKAAEKINHVYERYNRAILLNKAGAYQKSAVQEEQLSSEMAANQKKLLKAETALKEEQDHKIRLDHEKQILEQEKDSFNANDAVVLKKKEIETKQQIEQIKKEILTKEDQEQKKKDKWLDYSDRFNTSSEKEQMQSTLMMKKLNDMGDSLDMIYKDEHGYFASDFKENMGHEISFDVSFALLDQLSEKLEEGCEILKDKDYKQREHEKLVQQNDAEKKVRTAIERKLADAEAGLQDQINMQKESISKWNQSNQELNIDSEQMKEINHILDRFDIRSDYNDVRNVIFDASVKLKGVLQKSISRMEADRDIQESALQNLNAELEEWKNKKDPEPEMSDAVKKNRERLKKKNISYLRFYETVEFSDDIDTRQVNALEESLLEMGILDALIVDAANKDEVLSLDPGCCDKYIFADVKYQNHNIGKMLSVSEEYNDIFVSPKISSALGGIGIDENSDTFICEDGSYGIGVIKGTVSGDYQAKYIGKASRARYRESQIAVLTEQIANARQQMDDLDEKINSCKRSMQTIDEEYRKVPDETALHEITEAIIDLNQQLGQQMKVIQSLTDRLRLLTDEIKQLLEQAKVIADDINLDCRLETFKAGRQEIKDYYNSLRNLKADYAGYLQVCGERDTAREQMDETDSDLDDIRYELAGVRSRYQRQEMELDSIQQQLSLTNYEEIQQQLNACLTRLQAIPSESEETITRIADLVNEQKRLGDSIAGESDTLAQMNGRIALLKSNLKKELALGYTEYAKLFDDSAQDWQKSIGQMLEDLGTRQTGNSDVSALVESLNKVFFENHTLLIDFNPNIDHRFDEDRNEAYPDINPTRIEIMAKYRGEKTALSSLLQLLNEEIEETKNLITAENKELFEDILANTIGHKIRSRIYSSEVWVGKMNELMESMNTSSGLKLSLRWRSKTAEAEEQLDTKELVDLLKKDAQLMSQSDLNKLSEHFRSKVDQARRSAKDSVEPISFFAVMKDTLDYRKWFEFQLFFQKQGEQKKELTNSCFGTFSGGEKAMSMYVPLFSAVVAKYQGGREDAPRIISLDEAFAGVDNRNIRDMFRLMSEFEFNFIINSQVLWGDCDTLDGLAIYQLHRPNNQKFVTVMSFIWNGSERNNVAEIRN